MKMVKVRKSGVLGLSLDIRDDCDACYYCWNKTIKEKFGRDTIPPDTDIDQLMMQLERGRLPKPVLPELCQFYINDGRDILLGAKAEFFHPQSIEMAQNVLRLLECYPEIADRTRVLTKQDIRETSKGLLPDKCMIGATITTLSEDIAKSVEPGAIMTKLRIRMLEEYHDMGFRTWVVVEPFFKQMFLIDLAERLHFVDEMWVGRLNSGQKAITNAGKFAGLTCGELAMPDTEIVKQFKQLLGWMQEKTAVKTLGPASKRPLKRIRTTDPRFDGFNLYPKREVFRLLERDGSVGLLSESIIHSARAKRQS